MYIRVFVSLGIIASLSFLLLLGLFFTTWVPQAREGIRIQQEYDVYISEREIDGWVNVLHYFEEVRLHGDGFNKDEIIRDKYIIQGNDLIKVLNIIKAAVSIDDIAELKDVYAPIRIFHDEYK